MTDESARWLLDTCLPRTGFTTIDAVHVETLTRVPGPAGLREARVLGRTLVTCDEEFRGPCSLALEHPGIVIFQAPPVDAEEVERNLLHLEFRIEQYQGLLLLARNRFLIRADREVFLIGSEGEELEIEPWREVKVRLAPAMAV